MERVFKRLDSFADYLNAPGKFIYTISISSLTLACILVTVGIAGHSWFFGQSIWDYELNAPWVPAVRGLIVTAMLCMYAQLILSVITALNFVKVELHVKLLFAIFAGLGFITLLVAVGLAGHNACQHYCGYCYWMEVIGFILLFESILFGAVSHIWFRRTDV